MDKHTPGPWEADAGKPIVIWGPFPHRSRIAEVIQEWQGTRNVVEANAKLLTAAPDLLAACELAIHDLEALSLAIRPLASSESIAALRAAIAKARGGSNG
ncbi:MAG TPA: hypothetical protein VFT22_27690 [Kofleriaceae bacterium]|nr:hypothetical protein [Kofleriaceae bacterium]